MKIPKATVISDKEVIAASKKVGSVFPIMDIGELSLQLEAQVAVDQKLIQEAYEQGYAEMFNALLVDRK